MDIAIVRTGERRYVSTAARDDGVTVQIGSPDCPDWLPHDLAHYVVERELGLEQGFWGRVAAGAMFSGMTVVAGRRRPHAGSRARVAVREDAARLTQAEVLVGVFVDLARKGLDRYRTLALAHVTEAWSPTHRPLPIDQARIERVCAALRDAASRWQAVAIGGHVTVVWDLACRRRTLRKRAG